MPDTARNLTLDLLRVCAGPLVWAAHLGLVYALVALDCARGLPVAVPLAVGAATLAGLGAASWIAVGAWADFRAALPERRLIPFLAASLAGLSAVAILWAGLPAALVPSCS